MSTEVVPSSYLVTGYPALLARRMVEQVLRAEPEARVLLVAPARERQAVEPALGQIPGDWQERVVVLEGDPAHLDLGLSGAEYRKLAEQVTCVHHCHQTLDPDLGRVQAESINLGGMREVLELGRVAPRLRSLVVHSSTLVTGDRVGLVLEDELELGQRFPCAAVEMLARAERMARRASDELPVVVVRTAHVVDTAESDQAHEVGGVSTLLLSMLASADGWNEPDSWLDQPLDLVPVDYVTRAAHLLGLTPEAQGHGHHLSNPRPPSVRRVAGLVRASAERRHPGVALTLDAARAVLSPSWAKLLGRGRKALVQTFTARARHDTHQADRILGPAGIVCPPFDSYVDALVDCLLGRLPGCLPRGEGSGRAVAMACAGGSASELSELEVQDGGSEGGLCGGRSSP